MHKQTQGQSRKVISSSLVLLAVVSGSFLTATRISRQVSWSTAADTSPNPDSGKGKVTSDKVPAIPAVVGPASATDTADTSKSIRPALPELARKAEADADEAAFEKYDATAYCLKGKTAVGLPATVGIIAADPRVLPLGTIVHIKAGRFTGKYLVSDTGGRIRGHKVDIYVANHQEAILFGRRAVQLRVLGRYSKRSGAGTRLMELSSNQSATKPASILRQISE